MTRKPKPRAAEAAGRSVRMDELGSIRNEALSIFDPGDIRDELKGMIEELGLPKAPAPSSVNDDEWRMIMDEVLECAGPNSGDFQSDPFPHGDDEEQKNALSWQIHRVLRAIDLAPRHSNDGDCATGLLLPLTFGRRLAVLLGGGTLPIAWVRLGDVLAY